MPRRFLLVVMLPVLAACGRSGPPRTAPPPPPAAAPAAAKPEIKIAPEPADPLQLLEARQYLSRRGGSLPYRLFIPAGYDASSNDASRAYPLVVFLHGASASGTDNHRQLTGSGYWGTATWLSEQIQRTHPSFVLAPQANPPRGSAWVRQWRKPEALDGAEREPLEIVIELIDELQKEFAIDPARLYVTGLSMGGFGAWSAITRYPEKFAAAIPICGGGDPSSVGNNRTAVWAFHGAADILVSPQRSREMIEAFRRAGAESRYTEYQDLEHNSWERAYQEPELADWLFSQRRE
jgi:predicted peptidase